jgi:putative endonuclease
MKTYFVYIMASKSRTLYLGVTNNLERRVFQHRHKLLPGFTSRYNINRVVHFEVFGDIRAAIAREKQIKSWGRMKIALIESVNWDWKDLSADWFGAKRDSEARRPGSLAERDSSPSLRSGSE